MIRNLFKHFSLVGAAFVLAAGVSVGCGGDDNGNNTPADMSVAGIQDLAGTTTTGGDMKMTTTTGKEIGEACTKNADCGSGKTCVTQAMGWMGGYCSKSCTPSNDTCGDGATCVSLGSQSICIKICQDETECRNGYQCYVESALGVSPGGCYPTIDELLTCDPTANNGLCTTTAGADGGAGVAGGCSRFSFGTGNRGNCTELCTIGGSCPDLMGSAGPISQTCMVSFPSYDGDLFTGPQCAPLYDMPIADGAECKVGTNFYVNVCEDNLGCDLKAINASGDNKCHALCSLPGYKNAAGVDTTVACGSGTCTDVYMLASKDAKVRVGLCK